MAALLHCPIRGTLKVSARTKDGLRFSEEKRRVDCIRFLLKKGYPSSHFKIETTLLRFGHKGRNSFRTDLAVLDTPIASVEGDIDTWKQHIRLIAEIKRDNSDAVEAKKTQVEPALGFLENLDALGVYWDDLEQRLFYRTVQKGKARTHETTVAVLPTWGQGLGALGLRAENLEPSANLRQLFESIEDRLHPTLADKAARFEIMLQLLLAKLYDEHIHTKAEQEMSIQDFTDAPLTDTQVKKLFDDVLTGAVKYYGKYLPKEVPDSFKLSGSLLRSTSKLLAPIRVLGSKRGVIQDFYMYFAKGVYKWELAQYFTPTEVVDFIVELTNPRAGDQVKDPACGSGDFLISAFHHARAHGEDIRDSVWGADNSEQAVQVCVLNMVLNDDGKGNIRHQDSLAKVDDDADSFDVLLCNPPFGTRIVERRFEVLQKFELGHKWASVDGALTIGDQVLASQETGLLFAELCIKQTAPGGRVGIVLPNGYLGNSSHKYLVFREWLLRHARLVAVIAFPRFTFKKSGADVSASAVILQRRDEPLARAVDSEEYPFYPGILESVGWNLSGKTAGRIYRRDQELGAILVDDENEPIIDADFSRILSDLRLAAVVDAFPWLADAEEETAATGDGWSVNIADVLSRSDLCIDAKRWCERTARTRSEIEAQPHFRIGDVVDVIPEEGRPADQKAIHRYVEIQDISDGNATAIPLRGWQLPQRAKHRARAGELFVGAIWSSISAWFVASAGLDGAVVTNGFHRLRLKPNAAEYLVDLVAGLNTEGYRIQARAGCRGSDGLAELQPEDLLEIILPRVTSPDARASLGALVERLLAGSSSVASVVAGLEQNGLLMKVSEPPRTSIWVQV